MSQVKGKIVDIFERNIYPGIVSIDGSKISKIDKVEETQEFNQRYILPGFIDAHVHIESSMLTPIEFGKILARNGCVGAICDPHEIANVCGIDGVKYMIELAKKSCSKLFFCASPCVPASKFERSGAVLTPENIEELLKLPEVVALGEVMNFPGVISQDPDLLEKINLSLKYNKIVDGHAPGLTGPGLDKYIKAGVQTDHECYRVEEAVEKIKKGMKVQIREGSAAKNFEVLIPVIAKYPDDVLFCTDDAHPDRLLDGKHINKLVERSYEKRQNLGIDIFTILRAASKNAVELYNLPVGLLRVGDPADFVVVSSLENISTSILETWVDGKIVFSSEKTTTFFEEGGEGGNVEKTEPINFFKAQPVDLNSVRFGVPLEFFKKGMKVTVVGVVDGSLVTYREKIEMELERKEKGKDDKDEEEEGEEGSERKKYSDNIVSDVDRDILKTIVLCRYVEGKERPAIGFLRNFGLKHGAIASSVAHDSHNIIAIGTSDKEIVKAVNLVIKEKGGLVAVGKGKELVLPLPVGGLMSLGGYKEVAESYTELDRFVKEELGSGLSAPFMTLSFMALLVIPAVKISDKGLFDGDQFKFITWKDGDYQ